MTRVGQQVIGHVAAWLARTQGHDPLRMFDSLLRLLALLQLGDQPMDAGTELLAPNVFRSLFRYRPRQDTTANENFLTEALAYTLQRSKAASRACVRFLTNGRIDPAT